MELNDLIQSVDIVEFISQFVDLEEKNGEYWGLSCFKDEKTPSFSVRRDPPLFYDYSSGIGGNLYTFVKHYYNCSNKEAVNIIKKYAGVDGEVFVRREKMAATVTCKKFSKKIKGVKQNSSKPLPDNYMERYEYSLDKLSVWLKEGISKESIDKFQVKYDAFSDRIVYPIRNVNGKIVNIGGRTLDPNWKEKKLRKYCYFFSWGTMNTIYGLSENMDSIQDKKEIILFEGCKSVLLADTWGIHNCGAILTSHLNPNQLRILIKLGCRVVFALDKDVRIREDKHIQKLKQYVNVEFLWDYEDLLNEKDAPVDQGQKVFEHLYDKRLVLR
ncbi:dNA primase [Clostridium sp. CAG:678]|nr:dNA primase [Clostridium sp. CAG:678]